VKADVTDYLASLARLNLSGVTRARKFAAIREYLRHLVNHGQIEKSPAEGIDTPKREKRSRTALVPAEYNRLLALTGGNPRDYAILQLFLQSGIRISGL
jgi:site-specific recombinase XerC